MSTRRLLAHLTGCLALVVTVLTLVAPAADAAVRSPFDKVFSTQDNGAITIVGNSQMSCQTSVSGCTAARTGSGSNVNNNNYVMAFLDTDADATTTNSTTADLAMPSGSTVLYARLIWGARMTAGTSGVAGSGSVGTARFKAPGASSYSTVSGAVVRPGLTTGTNADPYQASLDVTATVAAAGNGTYAFADVVGATGQDRYAGWSLIVAYRNANAPVRDLSVFQGFADITTETTADSSVSTTVSGFLTPATGTVNATVGLVAWEGDYGTTGDVLKFNGTTLSDAARPSNNSFDSKISDLGANITARDPGYGNNLGVDMGRVSANGVLSNNQTSATVAASTTGDYVYLGALTTEIDLYTPAFVGVTKSVTNLSGNSPAQIGDTLEYRLSFTNSGQDYADNVVVRDPLPANITYVPGSLAIAAGANAGAVSDASDTDVGEYVDAGRLVRVRLGTGAGGSTGTGGSIPVGASGAVTFRVTVDRAAAGTSIVNGTDLDYRARTLGRDYTYVGNTVTTPVQAIADLGITATATPASQNAGGQVTYTLTVTNNGPAASTRVVTTDTLPAGTSYASSSPPSGTTCSASGQTVTCTTATLANGASLTIPIVATVAPGTAAGTLVDQAGVAADTTDDVTGNNTATATTTVTRSADLAVTQTAPASVVAGATVTYTLTTTNAGPSTATGTTLTDTLPVGVTLVSTSPSQGSCSDDSQTVTCDLGALAPNGTATVQVVARVAAASTATSIVNAASVTSAVPDPASADNSTSATTTVTRDADLTVTQTANPTTVTAGTTVNLTVTATDAGRSDANGVRVVATLPAGLTLVSISPTQGTCTTTATSYSCSLGTLTPGASARLAVLARVPADTAAGTIGTTAAGTTTTPETATGNNSGAVSVTVVSRADLTLTKTASPDPVEPGRNLTYTLTASNAGPSTASGVSIVDTLPSGTSFVSAGSSDSCSASGRTVTCTVGTIASGATATRTVVAATPGTLAAGSALVNQASVTSGNDPDTTNNQATYSSSLDPQADLAVTNTTSPGALVAGNAVTYTLTATNNGPSDATGVTVTDTLPTGVTLGSVTASDGGTCTTSGQTVTCTYAALAAGATRTVTVAASVNQDASTGPSTNSATVAATSPTDPTSSNNTATSTAGITRNADVSVVLTALTPTVRAGEEATYRVSIANAGPSLARNVVVTGQVPAGLDPVAGSSGGACTVSGQTVSCAVGSLPSGASGALTFRALVRPSTTAGPVVGTAYIGSTTPDGATANNSDDETLTVVTAADLQAGQSVTPTDLVAGGTGTFVLTATNAGPSDATGVTLTDTLPAGLTITSVDPSLGSCTVTGRAISCAADRLAPGAVLSVRVQVAVDPTLTGPVDNTVQVGSGVSDPQPGNDSDTTRTAVVVRADLRLGLTASPATPPGVVAGNALTYSLTAVNTGPATADAVVLEDTLPAEVDLLADQISAPAGVTCTVTGRTVRCPLGDLAPGDTASVTLVVRVPAGVAAGTDLVDAATLDSTTGDVDLTTRSASVTTGVVTRADLGVTLSPQSASPVAGATTSYVVSVVNHGPSVARDATVTDVLPTGFTYDSSANPAGTCTANGAGGTVTCTLGDLQPGEVVTLTLTAAVDPTAAGQQATSTVTVGSGTTDPSAGNDSATATQTVSAQNDLDVAVQLLDGPLVAGGTATYRLRVTNHGPSLARQVTVLDQIPDLLGYVGATAVDGGSCLYEPLPNTPADDDRIRCTWDTLAVGASTYADLVVSLPASLPDGQSVTDTVTAAANAVDPTPATAGTTDTVGTAADLSAIKTLLSGPPIAGEEIRWQVAVDNAGPSLARAVTLADPNPAGVTLAEAQTAQGTCTVAASGVDCALGDLAVGDEVVVTLSGTVDEGFTGGSLDNTATVDSPTADPTPGNDAASISTPVNARADLQVVVAGTAPTATAGATTTWRVTVTNHGPSAAQQVLITDTLPAGVTRVSQSLSGPGSGAGSCTVTPVIRCTVPTVAAGDSVVLTVVGRLDADYAGTAVTDDASATSAVADPNPVDNSDESSTPVARSADLALTMTGPPQATAGEAITWQVTVAGSGPSDATGVVVTDTLPDGLLGVSATFPGGTCALSAGVLSCPVGVVPAGQQVVVTVTGTVAPGTVAPSLTNQAAVTAQTADPDPGDRSASTTTTLASSAGLAVTNVATTDLVAGRAAAWRITVGNAGPSTARGVVVREVLPDDVTQVTTDTAGCSVTGQTLTCTRAALGPTGSFDVVVRGVVAAGSTATSLSTTATVESDTPDPDAGDDQATATDDVTRSADLGLAKELTSGVPVAGAAVGYTLTVTNHGPSLARGVQLTDDLPDDVEQAAATSPDGTCAVAGGTLTCDLDPIGDAGTATVTVTGVLAQAIGDDLVNAATVTAATPDPDASDNTATAEGSVNGVADLGVTMTGPATAVAGTSATYVVVVANAGPSIAGAATLDLDLPDGLGGIGIVAPAGVTCTADGRCALGDLDPGQSLTVRVTGTVGPGLDGAVLTTKALVDSDTADPRSSDQRALVGTTVTASADLSVAVTSDPAVLTPGVDSTYTLRVGNAGPSTARSVRVTTRLPEGMTLSGGGPTSTRGTCTASGRDVTCTITVLGPGDDVDVSLPVQLDPSYAAGSVALTATGSSATPDPDASDDQTTRTSTVAARADLRLRATAPARVTAGTPLAWALELSNDGPSDAQGVTVTDTLPAGVGTVFAQTDQGVCAQSGRTVTCVLGRVAAGAVVTIDLTTVGDLDPSYAPGTITDTATVTSATPDVGASDTDGTDGRAASVGTVVDVEADVSVSKTPTSTTAVAGGPVGWLITVVDQGPSTARDVVLTDADVTGLEDVTLTPPSGVTCTAARECDIGTLLPGPDHALVFSVSGTLADDYTDDTVVNNVSSTASTPDDDAGDDRAGSPVVVGRASGVSVVKTASSPYALPGEQVAWSITVHNEGPSAATGVVVTDQLPDGVTDVAVVAPAGVDCTGTATVTCDVGALAVGDAADVAVVVTGTLDPDYAGSTLGNTALVETTSPDAEPADDTSTATQLVTPGADLSITKTADRSTAVAGRGLTWTLQVANDGPATARDVTVTDPVPAGVTLGAVDGCTPTGGVLVCVLGDLAPGATRTLTVPARIATTYPGDLSNTATVVSTVPDADPDDNTATATTPVEMRADLTLVKTVDDTRVRVGSTVTFRIRVVNHGPSDAQAVAVDDAWPSRLELRSLQSSQGGYDVATDRWSVGDLGVDRRATLLMRARVTGTGTITNVARLVGAAAGDPDARNNGDRAVLDARARPGSTATTTDNDNDNSGSDASDSDSASGSDSDSGSGSGDGSLPDTGGPSFWLGFAGLAALVAGIGFVLSSRRRRTTG